jgi:predicted DCC family thiol-disulfide oxidoreductase YuxK
MTAAWMVRLDWRDRVRALPSQTPALVETLGLTADDAAAAAWAAMPDGSLRRGADAVYTGLDQLLPGGAPILSVVGRLPFMRQASGALYRTVARYRQALPGTAACATGPPPELSREDTAELVRRLAQRATS